MSEHMDASASTLGRCHTIELVYPAFKVYSEPAEFNPVWQSKDIVEGPILFPPQGVSERYEPGPLVPDGDVQTVNSRDTLAEASFCYVISAAPGKTMKMWGSNKPRPSKKTIMEPENFIEDVDQAVEFVGTTKLHIDYVKVRGTKEEFLCIERETSYWQSNGYKSPNNQKYFLKCGPILPITNVDPHSWVRGIVGLLNRTTDLAVRHVRINMQNRNETENGDYNWLTPRLPPYDHLFKGPSTAFSEPLRFTTDVKAFCETCRYNFNLTDKIAVELSCTGKHRFCTSCLSDHLSTEQLEDFWCTACNQNVIISQAEIDYLKYGLIDKTVYPDSRYSRWEMDEISCADLDKRPLLHTTGPQDPNQDHSNTLHDTDTINLPNVSTLLFMGWSEQVAQAKRQLQYPMIAPLELRLVQCPEFQFIDHTNREIYVGPEDQDSQAFVDWDEHEFDNMGVADIFYLTLSKVHRVLADVLLNGPLKDFLSPFERDVLSAVPEKLAGTLLMRRPGLKEFVDHLLRRTIRWAQLRNCECVGGERYHSHGLRSYWRQEVLTED